MRELPFIHGALDRGAELEVLLREDEHVEHLQDAELDVERIEVLLAHEGEIGSGRAAGRRPGSAGERFQADYLYTCAIRYWRADAAVSRHRRRIASADSRTRTGTSCPNRSYR